MQLYKLLGVITCVVAICSCKMKTEAKHDFLVSDLDTTVSPANDFFMYANGGWIKQNPIPADQSSWGVGELVQDDIYDRLKKINEQSITEKATNGSIAQKIGDFWYSGMDSAAAEKQGWQPLQEDLATIQKIQTVEQLLEVVASFHKKGINVMFNEGVYQDDKNSDVNAYQLGQGGLGMPNRDYYFNTDEKSENVRKAYQHYLVQVFTRLGNDSAKAAATADKVFQLETRLAKASRKLADLRDPYKNYHKMVYQLNGHFPNINRYSNTDLKESDCMDQELNVVELTIGITLVNTC